MEHDQDLRDWWTKIESIDAMQKHSGKSGATWAMAASYREIAIALLGELEQEKES